MSLMNFKARELLFFLESYRDYEETPEEFYENLKRLYEMGNISSDVFRILAEVLECNKKEETKSFISKVDKKEKERLREAAVSCSSSRRHC